MRAGHVGVLALLDELGEDGCGRLGEDMLERRGVADEEGVESEPVGRWRDRKSSSAFSF